MTTLGLALAWLQNGDDDPGFERTGARDPLPALRRTGSEEMIGDPAARGEAPTHISAVRGAGDRMAPPPIMQPERGPFALRP